MRKIRQEIKAEHGKDIVALMEKIGRLRNADKFNTLVILNKPGSSMSLVGISFAEKLEVDYSTGNPSIDLTDPDKVKDATASVGAIINALQRLEAGYVAFARQLIDATPGPDTPA